MRSFNPATIALAPIGLALFMALSGCAGQPGRDPAQVGLDAPGDAQASQAHIQGHMGINGCPAGFHPVNIQISTGSDAFVTIQNGRAQSSSAATGSRRQKCVPD
jgi:hypothetical protein